MGVCRQLVVSALILCAGLSLAQDTFAGKRGYPQTRSLSGLSGGGSAVLPDGTPSLHGALALSTPLGYTLGGGRLLMTGGTTSATAAPRWFDGEVATNGSNGTAALMYGLTFAGADLAVSFVQTSRLSEDRVVHLQLSPKMPKGRLGLSIGVQDLLDKTVTTPDYEVSAQTLFAAATYDAGGVYLSAGGGTKRFAKGFASLSAPLGNVARAMVENDGYGWNYGLEVPLFHTPTGGTASLFLGSCQGRYATWALSLRF